MSIPPISYIESIKRWVDYWIKFKGKRVRIWVRKGMKFSKELPDPFKFSGGGSIEIDLSENLEGTISEVIESPFGIMLKDISSTGTDTKNIKMIFIPMSEIARMDFLKQE